MRVFQHENDHKFDCFPLKNAHLCAQASVRPFRDPFQSLFLSSWLNVRTRCTKGVCVEHKALAVAVATAKGNDDGGNERH